MSFLYILMIMHGKKGSNDEFMYITKGFVDIVPCCISWRSPCLFNDFFLIPIHQFVCIIWIHGMILTTKVLASIQGSCNCSLPTWTTWIMHRIHQLCKTFVLTSKIVTVQDFHYLTKIVKLKYNIFEFKIFPDIKPQNCNQ